MEAILEVDKPEDMERLLSLDHPKGCLLCQPADAANGRRQLAAFAQWWLSEDRRREWGVGTFIEGRQREDEKAIDAVFKIRHPGRAQPIFVFYILVQHLEGKNLPHYQLQISFSEGSMGLAGEDAGLVSRVKGLFERACERTKALRHQRLVSISLHQELSPSATTVIQEAISDLVRGLARLEWETAR